MKFTSQLIQRKIIAFLASCNKVGEKEIVQALSFKNAKSTSQDNQLCYSVYCILYSTV